MRVRTDIHPVPRSPVPRSPVPRSPVPRSRVSAGRHTSPGVVDTYRTVEVSQAACPRGAKYRLPNPEFCLTTGCPRHEPRLYNGQHRRGDVVAYPDDVMAYRDAKPWPGGESLAWSATIKGETYGFGVSPELARNDALWNRSAEDSHDDGF